jgi:Bacterial Ig-like domain (group 3)
VDSVGHVISRAGSLSGESFGITYVPEPTSTSISASPGASTAGSPVTYSATVSSAGPPPTGTVTFADGSTTLCTAGISGGSGSCSATNTPQGSDTVQGSYSGDANSTSSSGTTQVSVSPSTQHGYWLVGSDGGIFTFGSAQFYGSTGNLHLQRPVVGITPTRDRGGYWLDASDGGIFAFGDAGFYGSMPGLGFNPAGSGLPHSLDAPIVGMVPSADGGGYFMVASDGGVFAFGDARFAGSCPGIGGCAGAAVAVMPDATGNGYWLVTQTGNVYAFGDAPFYGSPGQQSVPVTSAVRTPDGRGYWILFANGAIAYYGDAGEFGMPAGQMGGSNPAAAIFSTADGGGYWVAAANGAVANYGDAPNDGSMLGTRLNGAIIAGTGW